MEAVFCVSVFLVCGVGVFDRGYWLSFLSGAALCLRYTLEYLKELLRVMAAAVVKSAALIVLSHTGFEGLL